MGVLFLCTLPSTVQSSIAFTSIAGGNVSAAVVSASMSNLIGIVLTPLLVACCWRATARSVPRGKACWISCCSCCCRSCSATSSRRWIGALVDRHKPLLRLTDQGTVLLVVYTAFSAAVVEGLWRDTPVVRVALDTGGLCAAAGRGHDRW